ncbi:prephenate dehydrogenase [Cantharellus anzutake]|uniref:prephenate dehydrogenase n=1 Tax=Cantharellus anzutake TaxID=1750568 RepID=UPI001907E4FF|nr:prephenate dehydrogenase [Cantharellus anzutake]KAF8325427.1 prephenate dehydrogenase [Cantharellus anzutake]
MPAGLRRVSPSDRVELQPCIGLIGMGEMGSMYAKQLCSAGWKRVLACDRPERFAEVKEKWKDVHGITIVPDGHLVSRQADLIIYSVEAEFIDAVVAQFGPSTKVGAVVSGQTSVKAPERAAFEKYLPEDVKIVSIHSLYGPTVSPVGQPLVIIQHRACEVSVALVEDVLRPLGSKFVYMTYDEHDEITANTQAVTHAAFLSMGTAWCASESYPWEQGLYVGGIETVKVNITLRIYANKWHVYAGLAILNPYARVQINQYAQSVTEIFKLMIEGRKDELRERLYQARDKVFPPGQYRPILLSESLLDQFTLVPKPWKLRAPQHLPPRPSTPQANSHLSILAMVDSWAALGILPLAHLSLAATPIFRMWIGVADALFHNEVNLHRAIEAAIHDVSHRSDDLEFTVAARGWSQCVSFGSFKLYEERFKQTAKFFEPRFKEAAVLGSRMIKTILEDVEVREREQNSQSDGTSD